MDGAGDLLVDPDLYVIFTDGLDRRFETDIFLFELEFVLLLEGFADVLAGDGAEDAAVFPALDFDDDLDGLELGGHDDGFVCCDLALEFFRFLTLGGGIEVCLVPSTPRPLRMSTLRPYASATSMTSPFFPFSLRLAVIRLSFFFLLYLFTDLGQDDLFRCFFISIFAQLAAGHGEMTAAAQGFHDDLYIDRAVRAGRETESIVCVIEKETGPDLLHSHKVVCDLSGEYLGVFCPLRALGDRDIVINELHMGQDLCLGLDEVDVLRKEPVDELRICPAAAQEARRIEGTDAGLDGEVLRIDDDAA